MAQGPTFNQTTTGGSPQVNQGVTINDPTNITNNDGVADWKPPFIELEEQVQDKSWPEETPAEVVERFETPKVAVASAVAEIESDLAVETTDVDPVAFAAKEKTWGETFQAMVPMGIKLTSSVGMALAGHFTKKTAAGVAAEAFFTTISEMNS